MVLVVPALLAGRAFLAAVALQDLAAHLQPLRCIPATGRHVQAAKNIDELLANPLAWEEKSELVVVQPGAIIELAGADGAAGNAVNEPGMQRAVMGIAAANSLHHFASNTRLKPLL
jgi:hypothetical protein